MVISRRRLLTVSRLLSGGVKKLFRKGGTPTRVRDEKGFLLIETQKDLKRLIDAIRKSRELFLDSEADNMYHYRTRLCLLQFLVGKQTFIVDVLAPLELGPLWRAMEKKRLVLHGGDYDLRLLRDCGGFEPREIFDTMLAAQLLNCPKVGLGSLIEKHFGVVVDKRGQRANWSRRPIAPKLLDYAIGDVLYLPALRDILRRELVKLGRLSWFEQQCRHLIESTRTGFPEQDEFSWRIGGAERLKHAGLGVLHEIWHWRENWAKKLDVPSFKVCGNELLARVAQQAETGEDEERIFASIQLGKRHNRIFPSMKKAISAGMQLDPASLPKRKRQNRARPLTEEEIIFLENLKKCRDGLAERLRLPGTLIANRSQLTQLAREPGRLRELLLPWQADLLAGQMPGAFQKSR